MGSEAGGESGPPSPGLRRSHSVAHRAAARPRSDASGSGWQCLGRFPQLVDVHLRAARYGGQPSLKARVTRPANRSRERSERLAKVGGESGIRTPPRLADSVIYRLHKAGGAGNASDVVAPCPRLPARMRSGSVRFRASLMAVACVGCEVKARACPSALVPEQKCLDQLTVATHGHAGKALVPFTLGHVGLRVEPCREQRELRRGNLPALNAFQQMLQQRGRDMLSADFRHGCQMP